MVGREAFILDKIRYFCGKDPGLPSARAGKNELGTFRMNDRFLLHFVEDDPRSRRHGGGRTNHSVKLLSPVRLS